MMADSVKTKPTPPPPKHKGSTSVPPRQETVTSFKQLKHYKLPMRSAQVPEWKARLQEAGWPTTVVVIDFETYSDSQFSMRKEEWSTIEYIQDEKFEILGVSVTEMKQPFADYESSTHFWVGEDGTRQIIEHLQGQYGDNLEGCTVVAQNATFDAAVLSFRYGIVPRYLVDLLGLARHWNSRTNNDLGALCKRWGLPMKGETAEFKGWTFRTRKQKRRKNAKGPPKFMPKIKDDDIPKLAEYADNDAMREWELFTLLLPKVSNWVTELRINYHTLRLFLEPWLATDPEKGQEIISEMEAEIDRACADAGLTRTEASKDTWFDLMRQALVWADDDPARYEKIGKSGRLLAVAKDDPEREQLANHEDAQVRALLEARNAVKSWPLHIKRVNRILRQASSAGGYLPVPLKYHGAHTGRWSGGEKINLQNLGSRGHELVNRIRELLVAPEGHELVIADASQIEPRVLAWLAYQEDLLEKFARNEDTYCPFAEKVVGVKVRKPKKDGIPAIEARHKFNRNQIGKTGILGCGYGMGAEKTVSYTNGAIDLKTAEQIVQTYRKEHDKIVQFWHDLEGAFKYTYKYGKSCRLSRGLRFDQTGDCDVILTLPNGRELKYHNVQVKPDSYGESIRVWNNQEKKWTHIWGGYLTENVVQAVSRDILWEAMERLEQQGHRIVLHVHDELIAVTPEGTGNKVLNRAIEALSTRPTWAQDLPLTAEGVVQKRYGDH